MVLELNGRLRLCEYLSGNYGTTHITYITVYDNTPFLHEYFSYKLLSGSACRICLLYKFSLDTGIFKVNRSTFDRIANLYLISQNSNESLKGDEVDYRYSASKRSNHIKL